MLFYAEFEYYSNCHQCKTKLTAVRNYFKVRFCSIYHFKELSLFCTQLIVQIAKLERTSEYTNLVDLRVSILSHLQYHANRFLVES